MPQKNNVAYAVFVCFIVWFLFDVHLHNRSGRRSWATERVGTIGRIIHRIIPDKKTEMRNIKKKKGKKSGETVECTVNRCQCWKDETLEGQWQSLVKFSRMKRKKKELKAVIFHYRGKSSSENMAEYLV